MTAGMNCAALLDLLKMGAVTKHRSHGAAFQRQVAEECEVASNRLDRQETWRNRLTPARWHRYTLIWRRHAPGVQPT